METSEWLGPRRTTLRRPSLRVRERQDRDHRGDRQPEHRPDPRPRRRSRIAAPLSLLQAIKAYSTHETTRQASNRQARRRTKCESLPRGLSGRNARPDLARLVVSRNGSGRDSGRFPPFSVGVALPRHFGARLRLPQGSGVTKPPAHFFQRRTGPHRWRQTLLERLRRLPRRAR